MNKVSDTIFTGIAVIFIVFAVLNLIGFLVRMAADRPNAAFEYGLWFFIFINSGLALLYLNRINMNLRVISTTLRDKNKK